MGLLPYLDRLDMIKFCFLTKLTPSTWGFARGSSHSAFLAFSQAYVEHDLKKKKL
jgi:hypothetical protein